MNKFINKHKKTIFWIILMGFLFATFAYFGAGGILSQGADTVAKVNSQKISYREYRNNVARVINTQREQNPEGLNPEEMKNIQVGVLQNMISEEAFIQTAKSYKLKITQNELATYLQQIPAFQQNGKFDHKTYYRALQYGIHMSPVEFEESRRRALLVDRVKFIIFMSAKVTEKEAETEYQRRNGNVKNWNSEKDKFMETLKEEKANILFTAWVMQLQQKTKIKEYLSKFEKL